MFFVFILFCCFSFECIFPQPHFYSMQAEDKIIVDGIINESSWFQADSISNFIQVEPDFGKPADHKTVIRVLYNSEFLYVGGICYKKDKEESIRISDLKRDFVFEDSDGFGIILDLLNDRRNGTAFFINPLGAQRDVMVFDEKIIDENWDTKWYSETQINSISWTFEIAIPWSSLRYSPDTDSIGANFVRIARESNELSAWVPYPRTYTMFRLNYAGVINGLKFPQTNQDIRFTPYLLTQTKTGKNFPDYGNNIKPGVGMKWALTSNTLLDLTLNTDFAQAEADRDVINLTRFDILFPERRQFFLESAGLFKTGSTDEVIEPFFSRRIGLDDSGNPIPMDGGIRLVHRDIENNYGFLTARTHIPDSLNSFFLIGRYSQNYGEQNRFGFLTTYRRDNFNDRIDYNIVAATDGFNKMGNAFSFNWMLSGSSSLVKKERKYYGYSQSASLTYLTEDINLFFKEYLISEDYSVASGFVAAKNISSMKTGTDLYLRPQWKPDFVRDFEPGLYFDYCGNVNDGRLREFYITIWPIYILFQNGAVFSAKWLPNWENLYEEFSPAKDVIFKNGRYFYNRYEFRIASDPSASFYYSFLFSTGSYFDGSLSKLSSQITYRPIVNISISFNYEPNWFSDAGISRSNEKIEIISSELNLALNPFISLNGFYQYNDEEKSSLINFRFAWEYSPLSYFYILYNIGKSSSVGEMDVNHIQLMLKLSHQFQL